MTDLNLIISYDKYFHILYLLHEDLMPTHYFIPDKRYKIVKISLFLDNRLFLIFVHFINNSDEHLKTQGLVHILDYF